jgi:hypothetical protein
MKPTSDDALDAPASQVAAEPVAGSKDAKRMAALILETLAGLRSAPEASEAMGIALARYYVLEARALEAIIQAMEPRPRGRPRTPEAELERLRADVSRLEREVLRYQTLHRISQRAIGVPREESPAPRSARGARTVRARKKRSRGERVLARMNGAGRKAIAPASSPVSESSPKASAGSPEEV